jgi:mannose-6-phosphate isomerase-like protein (cupin superfamily)
MIFGDVLRYREALRAVRSGNQPFATLFEDGGISIELYVPREVDRQQPHSRDEIYIVASGGGEYVVQGRRYECGPNDILFAAAHTPHRFENFSDDFAVWVVFFGEEREKG